MLQGQKAGDGGGTLKDHLQLAGYLGGKITPLLLDEAADGGDEHFAPHDDNGHPRRDAAGGPFAREKDERAADDDLIDERIEDAAKLGHLAVLAGPPTVDPVGRSRDDEDDHRSEVVLQRNQHEDDD